MEFEFSELKEIIKDDSRRTNETHEILRSISNFCNSREDIDQGRELLIRALEYKLDFDEVVLNSLLRKVGLFPYIEWQSGDRSFSDDLAYELHKPKSGDLVFHSLQAKVYNKIINGENIVLSAPTSFGKSILIDSLIESGKFSRLVIILPTLALIDETRQRIVERFPENVKVITHSSQSENDQVGSVNIYALTQERAIELDKFDNIDLLIVDEFYKIDPKFEEADERSLLLNYAFHKLIKVSKQFYLLGPNIESVSGLDFYGKDFYFIPTQFTTVAADIYNYNYKTNDPGRDSKLKELVFSDSSPKIVYCQSPSSASKVARLLVDHGSFDIDDEVTNAIKWIENNYSPYWIVAEALKSGIGIHHGGVPRALQQWMVKAFNSGLIKALVCTSTIIEGVNTVAKTVVLYDRRKANNVLDFFSFKNIIGRAGRMGEHFVGKAHILESAPESEFFDVSFPISFPESYTRASWHLLHDDEDEKPPIPEGRFDNLLNNDLLNRDFLKKNLPLSIEGQIQVAKDFKKNLDFFEDVLFSGEYPNYGEKEELLLICFDAFLSNAGQRYGVFSHTQLLHKVESILRAPSLSSYLKERVANKNDEPSLVVENELRFIRNIMGFSLPRSIKAVIKIAQEISEQKLKVEALEVYALQIENLGIQPAFFALEEFGVPFQVAKKLDHFFRTLYPEDTPSIDEAVAFVKTIAKSNNGPAFSEFERVLLSRFEQSTR
jgi:uncharacterized protein YkuJ/rhodanese-related sulfurtransferase